MSKVIAVTGGAGYIGSHLVRQLLERGDTVRVVDSGLFGYGGLPESAGVTLFPSHVQNLTVLYNVFKDVDAVVHLAGLVGDPACARDPRVTNVENIGGTRFVKEVVSFLKIPQLIFASSCSVYGNLDKVGREDGPVNPVSLYARTKMQSEWELLSDPDLPVTILRFSTVYGHSARPRFDLVANLFTAQAVQEDQLTVKSPYAWRPFIHVEDVAGAVIAALDTRAHITHRRTYNVGGDRFNLTIGQLGSLVQEIVESAYHPVTITTDTNVTDTRDYRVCFDRIKEELNWEPVRSLASGISEMAHYAAISTQDGGYGDYKQTRYHNHLVDMPREEVLV